MFNCIKVGGENDMANKAELVSNVASATGLTKKDATAAVDAVFSSIQASLAKERNGEVGGSTNIKKGAFCPHCQL